MKLRTRFLPALALALGAAACTESGQTLSPEIPLDVPEPSYWVGEDAEVNTSFDISPIQCGAGRSLFVTLEGVTPAPEDSPLDVLVVIDESGSISSQEYAAVIAAGQSFVEAIDAADGADDSQLAAARIGVVKYSSTASLRLPLSHGNFNNAALTLSNRYFPGGSTNTAQALEAAYQHLQSYARPNAARAVVLMTDGYPTTSGSIGKAQQLRAAGVRVFVVGVGTDLNPQEMTSVADPGAYYPVADFDGLTTAFEDIAGQISYPAATNLTFTATVPSGAGVYTIPASISADKGTTSYDAGTGVITWTVDRLAAETATLTIPIGHDAAAAPQGGTLVALDNVSLELTTPKSGSPVTETFADVEAIVEGCDTTPPSVSYTLTGAQGDNDWFVGDVALAWTVVDEESPIDAVVGCEDQNVTVDGEAYTFSCQATSAGGTSEVVTATFKRDATAPTVGFTGNAMSYDIADDVAITCSSDDDLSGIASDTCATLAGGAWSFGLGTTTFSADATDNAGNTANASGSFTVTASLEGLCTLVEAWVDHKGVANSLCVKVAAAGRAAERGNDKAHDNAMGAFINEVAAQSGKKIDADKAALLSSFAQALID